jgi:hypothetical protein
MTFHRQDSLAGALPPARWRPVPGILPVACPRANSIIGKKLGAPNDRMKGNWIDWGCGTKREVCVCDTNRYVLFRFDRFLGGGPNGAGVLSTFVDPGLTIDDWTNKCCISLDRAGEEEETDTAALLKRAKKKTHSSMST